MPRFAWPPGEHTDAYATIMQESIQRADGDDVCGWMIDPRRNTGGNLAAMIGGLGPFFGEGEVGDVR